MRPSIRCAVLSALVVLLAACSSTRAASFPVRAQSPEYVAQQDEIRRLEDEREALSRAAAREALDDVGATTDRARRIELLERAFLLDRHQLTDRGPAHLAAVAPDVLRVYELSAVLAQGTDVDVVALDPLDDVASSEPSVQAMGLSGTEGGAGRDGAGARLGRIRDAVQAAVPGAAFVGLTGEHLFVCGAQDDLARAERSLDRVARVGAGAIAVALRRVKLDSTGRSAPEEIEWLTDAASDVWDFAIDAAPRLRIVAPFGSRRGAAELDERAYLRDFDLEAGTGLADPQIGRVIRGLACNVLLDEDEAGVARLALDLVVADGPETITTFSTHLGRSGSGSVLPVARFQLPETRVRGLREVVVPRRGAVAVAPGARGELLLIRIDDVRTSPSAPAWRRVQGGGVGGGLVLDDLHDQALMVNAAGLASTYLAAGRNDAADALDRGLRTSVSAAGGTFRARLGPERTPVALVSRPFDGDADRLRDLLARFDVRTARTAGFLRIDDGRLTASLRASDVDGLDRVLAAFAREQDDVRLRLAATRKGADGAVSGATVLPGVPVAALDADSLSYIADFDLQVARRAAILDPIVGQVRSGVRAEVWSRFAGPLDVRMERVETVHPIATFELEFAMGGPPVTIQLPRLRRTISWTSADVSDGRAVSLPDRDGVAIFELAPIRSAADSR